MTRRARNGSALIALALVAGLTGCKRERADEVSQIPPASLPAPTAAVRVVDVDLGRGIGADKRVLAEIDDFRPADTVYAVVATEGMGENLPVVVRWTFQDGQAVDEMTQTISPMGPAMTEFHISKPTGLPEGKYKVEVLLNGASVQTKEFEVKK